MLLCVPFYLLEPVWMHFKRRKSHKKFKLQFADAHIQMFFSVLPYTCRNMTWHHKHIHSSHTDNNGGDSVELASHIEFWAHHGAPHFILFYIAFTFLTTYVVVSMFCRLLYCFHPFICTNLFLILQVFFLLHYKLLTTVSTYYVVIKGLSVGWKPQSFAKAKTEVRPYYYFQYLFLPLNV